MLGYWGPEESEYSLGMEEMGGLFRSAHTLVDSSLELCVV